MRIALVNLPHPIPVVRRYMCSYNSPFFLFPPLELLYAATAAREMAGAEVTVIDAIASRSTEQELLAQLRAWSPDLVVTITGFEIFEQDVRICRRLREALPDVRFAAFGHYPTIFPAEMVEAANVDFVLRGEPEDTLVELCAALERGESLDAIKGLSWRGSDGATAHNPDRPRSRHIDQLPHPDYGLVEIRRYSEVLLPRPFAVLQTARGCPYPCNFCVRSYGQQLGMRSPANILEEIEQLVERFHIRSFRFIDDTFTAIPSRTSQICAGIEERFPGLVWCCLSRVDTLDEARVEALSRAGCRRVYIGIESGSPRILRSYGKDYSIERIEQTVGLLKRHQVEVGAFFMVGHPEETADDFEQTVQLLRSLDPDYAGVSQLVAYPGTSLFEQYRSEVDFSLIPYRNEWKNPHRRGELAQWEKQFYRDLYFRVPYVARNAWRMLRYPRTAWAAGKALLRFTYGSGPTEAVRGELI